MKQLLPLLLALVLVSSVGCKPKEIPAVQRKEAAHAASEAEFALTLHDYARAEPLFEKAAKLSPDIGEYWINLGVTRRRLGNKSGAKTAYEKAAEAFADTFKADATKTDAALQQVYSLALLGKTDEARKVLEKARKKLPDNRQLRAFEEAKQLDHLLEDATFKEIAL